MDAGALGWERGWSWAASGAEAASRRQEAEGLVGQRIRTIRYVTIDYRREELHPDLIDGGPRTIHAASEWNEPTWAYDAFDAMDYGLEVVTEAGATFSVTWDPPGEREGIGLQPVPLLGGAVRSDADVAIWELDGRALSWGHMVGRLVTGVQLHYIPWDAQRGTMWCPHITLHGERGGVEIVMGDSDDGTLVGSADNVAVLHPGTPLPVWLASND
jgi:hypothetical protein